MTILKKLGIAAGISLSLLLPAYAGNFYAAPTIVYESINATGIRYENFNPRLAVGFGDFYSENIYISGEVFASPGTFSRNNAPDQNASLKTSYSYGASVLPGYFFDGVIMGFGRLGFIGSNFTNLDRLATGYQMGLGLNWMVTRVWSVRGEYDYTWYGKLPRVGDTNSNQYSVGLVYTFE